MIPTLAVISQRAGVSSEVANAAYIKAHVPPPDSMPWAKEVEVDGRRLVVGQGRDLRFFVAFDCPFSGHADDWQVIQPINNAEDLLSQLRG